MRQQVDMQASAAICNAIRERHRSTILAVRSPDGQLVLWARCKFNKIRQSQSFVLVCEMAKAKQL
jgi:hypothetical protein